MPQLLRKPLKAVAKGLGLANPPDLLAEGLYPILNNVQATQQGDITSRPPIGLLITGASIHPILDIKRINDPVTNTFTRVASDGTNLMTGQTALTVAATGYSGNRPSLVQVRPDKSPSPWIYVADKNKCSKVNVAGTVYQTGITPPQTEPTATLGILNSSLVNDFTNPTSWTTLGTAGIPAVLLRVNTTIANILYDSNTFGWCCLNLAVMSFNVQAGMYLLLNSVERVIVHDVFEPFASTTIASILYDSGTTGLCSITLTVTPSIGLSRNAMIQLTAENIRVLSMTTGPNNTVSFRCLTTVNHIVGETVTSLPSCRVYTAAAHAVGQIVTASEFQSSIAAGTGSIQLVAALDLSTCNNRPLTVDDYIHISVALDLPANLVEGRFSLDVDAVTNDFQHNFYYYPFRQSDFQSNAAGTQTAIQANSLAGQYALIQNTVNKVPTQSTFDTNTGTTLYGDFLNNPNIPQATKDAYKTRLTNSAAQTQQQYNTYIAANNANLTTANTTTPISSQTVTGIGQWTEFKIKIGSLVRAGSDITRTLANVKAISIQLTVTAPTTLSVSSWWVGGSYGPDVYQTSTPIFYGFRYRSTITGAVSNMSPSVRNGDIPMREQMLISVLQSADPQVDKIDICRFGGSVNSWRLALTVPNLTGAYADESTNAAISVGDQILFDNYVPFATSDLPHHGYCNVSGTTVQWYLGDQFNPLWVTGSLIVINNLAYTLSRSPNSTTILQTIENVGKYTNVPFFLSEPTLYATNLPYTWDGGTQNNNVIFACGDFLNPGYLYWTKPGNPDTASDVNNVEVTSPSEPLLGGFNYDGRSYCFSTEQLYIINSATAIGNQTVNFVAQILPIGKGIPFPFFFDVGPTVLFGSREGLNSWGGSNSSSITDDSLFPLFPHKGVVGSAVNGYNPIDYTKPLSLNYTGDSLYFFYSDTLGVRRCMLYELVRGGWFPNNFTPGGVAVGMYCAYQEEGQVNSILLGGADGNIYSYSIPGEIVHSQIRTYCVDFGDSRSQKLFTDFMVDITGSMATTIYYDNFKTSVTYSGASQVTRGQTPISTTLDGLNLHLNASLDLTWLGGGTFYEFQPSAYLQPFLAPVYIAQATDHGFTTYGFGRDARVSLISTANVVILATVDGVEIILFTIPSTNGKLIKYYSPVPVYKGKLILYKAVSAVPFMLFADETMFSIKEWGSTGPFQPYRPFAGVVNG